MAKPTKETREAMYIRDGYRCLMCGAIEPLSFGHRRAVGMGGSLILPPPIDGVTQCIVCNGLCENSMQDRALATGWKVRRWVQNPELVPVYYPLEFAWHRLEGTRRIRISSEVAMEMGCRVYGDEWLQWRMEVMAGVR